LTKPADLASVEEVLRRVTASAAPHVTEREPG
jgi:hypothetical protein